MLFFGHCFITTVQCCEECFLDLAVLLLAVCYIRFPPISVLSKILFFVILFFNFNFLVEKHLKYISFLISDSEHNALDVCHGRLRCFLIQKPEDHLFAALFKQLLLLS